MKQVSFTKHASVRCQQRGIGEKIIPLIMDYGHFNYGRDGSKVYCLNKTERSMVRADLGKSLFNKIEKQLGYVVLSRDNKVITVGHTYKRVRRQ